MIPFRFHLSALPDATGFSLFAIAIPPLSQRFKDGNGALPPLKLWITKNYWRVTDTTRLLIVISICEIWSMQMKFRVDVHVGLGRKSSNLALTGVSVRVLVLYLLLAIRVFNVDGSTISTG
jgi:hypothetical protein